jgi:hypothetical protein
MTTKEIQEKLVETMQRWEKIEDAAVDSTGKIIESTDNPLIRLVMEIIQADSRMHRRVQEFIASTLTEKAVSLTPEELGKVSEAIDKHNAIEKQMVGYVDETLNALKGKKMLVQEYLLNYLWDDEKKHETLLSILDKVKEGMYPYAG